MTKIAAFSEDDGHRIADVVRRLGPKRGGRRAAGRRGMDTIIHRPVVIKAPSGGIPARSGTTAGSATCDVYKNDGGTLTDTTENITVYNLAEEKKLVNGDRYGVANPDKFGLYWVSTQDDASTLFAVNMTQTGGANGTSTTAATWTYTVADLDGNSLATAYDPSTTGSGKFRRPTIGQMVAANFGLAYYDGSSLIVAWCNEQVGPAECA